MQRLSVKHLVPSTLVAFAILQGAAVAAELPTYEFKSFPATSHQLTVVGNTNVQEQTPAPVLIRADMPASPHQLAVLAPHRRSAALIAPTTVASSHN
jgi:hypothetical protein